MRLRRRDPDVPAPEVTEPSQVPAPFASVLPARHPLVVVVLADGTVGPVLGDLLDALGSNELHVVSPEADPGWELERRDVKHHEAIGFEQINWVVRYIGTPDLIINLMSATASEHQRMWERLLFHLGAKGVFAFSRRAITDDSGLAAMTRLLLVVSRLGPGGGNVEGLSALDAELVRANAQVVVGNEWVLSIKRNKHLLKVRDADASRLLASRGTRLRVSELATLPAGVLESRAQVTSHESTAEITALDEQLAYPAHHLRLYEGRVAMVANALLYSEHSILPDSFRHHLERSLRNPRIIDSNVEFARVPERWRPTDRLEGIYYHLDAENSGHFGHLTTEVISRLWGWDLAKREHPDLKAVFRIRHPNERRPVLEQRLLGAFGIEQSDIVWTDDSVWLDKVVAATPMWHNQVPHYVHPDIATTWNRITDGLLDSSVEGYDRLFVSRRTTTSNRSCRNVPEVEEWFSRHGFHVIYPEDLDLAVQVSLFAQARVVAGFGGSALFNVMHSRKLETLIVLNHEAYTARNEHLFTAVIGCDVHYVWSEPDVGHPSGGWSEAAYYSEWEFDWARNTRVLEEIVTGLG